MINPWFVYIVQCADATLYTGITTDPERRRHEHNSLKKGARYTKTRRPVRLVYIEEAASRSDAARREYAIKQMSPRDKLILIGKGAG
jgi:putative endonuclease